MYADEEFNKKYRKIYEYGQAWDEIAFRERFEAEGNDMEQLEKEMNLMRQYEDAIEKGRQSHICGFILIDAKQLKLDLQPVRTIILNTIASN